MRIQPSATLSGFLLALILSSPAAAQVTTTTEGLSLRSTMTQLLQPTASAPLGEGVALATSLEVATAPLPTPSGGFLFQVDPTTGLRVRTASTFGPSFAERALTVGAGKLIGGAALSIASYDKLGELKLAEMEVSSIGAAGNVPTRVGHASLVLSSQTLVMMGAMGATDNLDIIVAVPMVKVELDGLAWVQRADDIVAVRAVGGGLGSGIGDVGVSAKYRFLRFGGEQQPDPGGLAVMLSSRLPTGDADNLRGLGITRVGGTFIFSSGRGRVRPHANLGFEWWEKGLTARSGATPTSTVTARHQVLYAAGVEFEAAPRLTVVADFLGRHILGAGRLDATQPYQLAPGNPLGVNALDALAATGNGLRKLAVVPGLKWNVKGAVLITVHARIPVSDNGLHDTFTPVVGLEWGF